MDKARLKEDLLLNREGFMTILMVLAVHHIISILKMILELVPSILMQSKSNTTAKGKHLINQNKIKKFEQWLTNIETIKRQKVELLRYCSARKFCEQM